MSDMKANKALQRVPLAATLRQFGHDIGKKLDHFTAKLGREEGPPTGVRSVVKRAFALAPQQKVVDVITHTKPNPGALLYEHGRSQVRARTGFIRASLTGLGAHTGLMQRTNKAATKKTLRDENLEAAGEVASHIGSTTKSFIVGWKGSAREAMAHHILEANICRNGQTGKGAVYTWRRAIEKMYDIPSPEQYHDLKPYDVYCQEKYTAKRNKDKEAQKISKSMSDLKKVMDFTVAATESRAAIHANRLIQSERKLTKAKEKLLDIQRDHGKDSHQYTKQDQLVNGLKAKHIKADIRSQDTARIASKVHNMNENFEINSLGCFEDLRENQNLKIPEGWGSEPKKKRNTD